MSWVQRAALSAKRGSATSSGISSAVARRSNVRCELAEMPIQRPVLRRLVGVARRILNGETVALALLDDAELVEDDHLRLDEAEQRLVEAHVDLLAGAVAVVAVIDGKHG